MLLVVDGSQVRRSWQTMILPPNPRLQRTGLRLPLSRKPFGAN